MSDEQQRRLWCYRFGWLAGAEGRTSPEASLILEYPEEYRQGEQDGLRALESALRDRTPFLARVQETAREIQSRPAWMNAGISLNEEHFVTYTKKEP